MANLEVHMFLAQVRALRSYGDDIVPGLPAAEFLVRTQPLLSSAVFADFSWSQGESRQSEKRLIIRLI